MQILDNISVKRRMLAAFSVIGSMLIFFGIYTLIEMEELGALTETLYEHPLRVSNASLAAQGGIVSMHRDMKDVTLANNEFELLEAVRRVQAEEKEVYAQLDIVQQYILGDEGKALAQDARETFAAWKPIRLKVEGLIHSGKRLEAATITKGEGAEHVLLLEDKMAALTRYARQKADGFIQNAREVQQVIRTGTMLTLSLGVAFTIFLSLFVSKSFARRLDELQAAVSRITKTGQLEEIQSSGRNEIAELAVSFNELIKSLKRQFWIREGLNKLNREVAGVESLATACEAALIFISRHMEACTSALFLHDAKTKGNELLTSYAFVKRKLLSNYFKEGEGIVGQVAREKKTIRLLHVDKEEAVMVSGTTSNVPQEIVAIPLVYSEELLGVLEVASLTALGAEKLEFLESASHVVATAIHAAKQREHIDVLYETAKDANVQLEEQRAELHMANEELEVRNQQLSSQSEELQAQALELKNQAGELMVQKRELEIQQVQVEEADRLKSEFLSNMSHELRTPLNSIMALSQLMLLKGTGVDLEKDNEHLRVIERNGRHLLMLINDILDLSKIESGHMDFHITEFNFAALIDDVVDTVKPLAEEKQLTVNLELASELLVRSDWDKVRQIVLNLLSNAIKFTDQGEISVLLNYEGDSCQLAVRDTGIGIKEEDLEDIFDEFRQVDGSTTRRHEGTGLGLAICKKLAELLGGDLNVQSNPGQGSTFTLTLPVSSTILENASASIRDMDSWTEFGAKTVLVVDDDFESRRIVAGFLEDSGYAVLEASNGKEALSIAEGRDLFAITLDILMPEMDGWEVLRKLKMSEKTKSIPVVIISVSSDMGTGAALGASGYLVKPVDQARLMDEMKRIVATRQVDTILIVDDDAIMRQQLVIPLEKIGYTVFEAADGEEAMQMAKIHHPDVMLLDLMMPNVDGFQVLGQLAAHEELKELPVIIISAKDLSGEEKKFLYERTRSVIQKGSMNLASLLERLDKDLEAISFANETVLQLQAPRVVVVEDNAIAAMQVVSALEEIGCRVFHASDGEKAIELVQSVIPDLIVLDIMMPGTNGFEVLEAVRSFKETESIPVVVLTAKELTSIELKRLKGNNIRQLLKKGGVDRDSLQRLALKIVKEKSIVSAATVPQTSPRQLERRSVPEKDQIILVVEDNEDNITTIKAVLEEFTGTLEFARDGEIAIEKAEQLEPDLIFMDIQLPGMSGLEITRHLKNDRRFTMTPIVALTAKAMKGDFVDMEDAGCDDVLTKPYSPEQLQSMWRKWLKGEG